MSERFVVTGTSATSITVEAGKPWMVHPATGDTIVIYGPRWRDRLARMFRYYWLRFKRLVR